MGEDGNNYRIVATIGAIVAIIGGISALFMPLQAQVERLQQEITLLSQEVRDHGDLAAHPNASEILRFQKERLDRDFKTIADASRELDNKLQMEMRSLNTITDQKIIGLDKAIQREMRNLDDVQAAQLSFIKEMVNQMSRRLDRLERSSGRQ